MKFCRDTSTGRVKQTTYLVWQRDRCSHNTFYKFYIITAQFIFVKYQNETTLTQVLVEREGIYLSLLVQFVFNYHLPYESPNSR